MEEKMSVVGILVNERDHRAPDVQEILTKYGTDIYCRMGIPSPSKEKGLITLVIEAEKAENLLADLRKTGEGFLSAKKMDF